MWAASPAAIAILKAALDAFGRVDILSTMRHPARQVLLKMEEDDWDEVVRVHLKGAFCVTKPIFGHMKERGTAASSSHDLDRRPARQVWPDQLWVRQGRPLGLFEFIGAGRPEVRRPRVDHRAGRASQLTADVSDDIKSFTPDLSQRFAVIGQRSLGKQTGKTLLSGAARQQSACRSAGIRSRRAFRGDRPVPRSSRQVMLPEAICCTSIAYGPTAKSL